MRKHLTIMIVITTSLMLIFISALIYTKSEDKSKFPDLHKEIKMSSSYIEIEQNYELINGKEIRIIGIGFDNGSKFNPIILYESDLPALSMHLIEPYSAGGSGTNDIAKFKTEEPVKSHLKLRVEFANNSTREGYEIIIEL